MKTYHYVVRLNITPYIKDFENQCNALNWSSDKYLMCKKGDILLALIPHEHIVSVEAVEDAEE